MPLSRRPPEEAPPPETPRPVALERSIALLRRAGREPTVVQRATSLAPSARLRLAHELGPAEVARVMAELEEEART
jgi:hypothetical protein